MIFRINNDNLEFNWSSLLKPADKRVIQGLRRDTENSNLFFHYYF